MIDNRRIDTEKGERPASRFGRDRPGQWRDHDHAGFGLPPGIDNRTAPAANVFLIPHPRFGINRFADRSEQTQRRQIVFLHPLIAPANERADCSRRGVENVNAVLFDDFPKAIRLRPVRRAFVHERGRAVGERTVNHVAVAGHPTDVRGAPKNIFVAKIEHIFRRRINSDQVTAGRVQNPFRLSGRTAGVKNVKRMFAVDRRWRTIVIHVLELAMPPNIAALFHVDFIVRALEDNHPLHRCASPQRVIHIFFQRNNAAPPITSVRGDQRDRATVGNPIAN